MTLTTEMITHLKTLARKTTHREAAEEDNADGFFNPFEASGGNYDDAYSMGEHDGEIFLAREVLTEAGISWAE